MVTLVEAMEALKKYYLKKVSELVKAQEEIKAQDTSSDNNDAVEVEECNLTRKKKS